MIGIEELEKLRRPEGRLEREITERCLRSRLQLEQ